ncbi:hypothetical protein GCWU000324_02648 [Kingella oralis ATCC 51147]|uniref:Uncharacterized protein n=1 Tax=Kingella oralis ATCC 51147 TaxID=629741 RepID=C4GLS8_9NEIS|nr:hypothetical protein GCWU000324_02648 [Kingella oralis ATCC 51147]
MLQNRISSYDSLCLHDANAATLPRILQAIAPIRKQLYTTRFQAA